MKKRTLIIIFFAVIVTLAALIVSAWYFARHQLSHLETYKSTLTATVSKALNRQVTYETGKATLTFRQGLALQFTNVVIREKDQSSDLLNVRTAWVRVDVLPLIVNRVNLGQVILDSPRLALKRDRAGVLNIADLLKMDEQQKLAVSFRKVTIEKGLLTFVDQAVTPEGLTTSLADISCRINKSFFSNKSTFGITAAVLEGKNQGNLTLAGTVRPAPGDQPLTESTAEGTFHLQGTDLRHYLPYVNRHAQIESMAGRLDAEAAFSGTLLRFSSKGTLTLKSARLQYPAVFQEPLKSATIRLDYNLSRSAGDLQIDVARLTLDRFEAAGRLSLRGMDQEDPQLTATATSQFFSLKKIHSYVPWKIIPGGVGDFIQEHIRDGDFRLLEGRLDGRLSQISNINSSGNAGVLSIRAQVNKGIFVIDESTPRFQDLSGTLELINRQFMLKNIKGFFGESPCTVEGGISDFALAGSSVYNAEMTLQPARSEILWLLGKDNFQDFRFDRVSALKLSGKGPAEKYQISARWDLANAAYAFPEILEKPAGKSNTLSCEIVLNKDQLAVTSFHYSLPPINVSGSAGNLFADKKSVVLNVQAKSFDLAEVAPLLPSLRTYDPKGTCLIDVNGRGNLGDAASFRWKGSMSLTGAGLKMPGNIKPLKGLTGKAVFLGTRMETSPSRVSIGDSPVQVKCGIDRFGKTKVTCQFDAALLKTADLGLESNEGEVNLQDVRGKAVIEGKSIHVDRLMLRLGKSRFNVSGDIRNFENPIITLSLNSRYIRWDDVAPLIALKSPAKTDTSSAGGELQAELHIDAGVFQDIDFSRLNAHLTYSGGILNFETLEAGVFDGTLRSRLRVDAVPPDGNFYQANFSLERASLEKIQDFLDLDDRTVTGRLSVTGNVTAAGSNEEEIKKSAAGTFQVRAEKGVLKKFSVLSKIFSLLNVSQLFKLQLPDMARDGMPYNAITGKVSLAGGVLSSDDFFIASDAMQISGVGKIDFIKKELDNIVGVHPLLTVDKIVSRIPVAGWLVTNEKGNLITVHFKVDGTWDNPSVRPIPAQSLAKGTLDIFRRLFQLPEKLVTDTGEVLLGH